MSKLLKECHFLLFGNYSVTHSKYCPWFVFVWTVGRVQASGFVFFVRGPGFLSPRIVFSGQLAVFELRGSCFLDSGPCLSVRVSENLDREPCCSQGL